jgi:DUF4097 and DUF4098 domain-containing protein YvlB
MKRPIVIVLLTIALVFVLAGIGATIFFATRGNGNFFSGKMPAYATAEENKNLKVDAETPVTLKVVDDAGSVTIIGADVATVQVKVIKTAYAPSQSRADEEVKNIKYDIDQVGNIITLAYEYPTVRTSPPNIPVFDANADTVDFVVTVPIETTIDVNNNLGDVSITNIKGNVTIENDFGEVDVQKIEGTLSVSSNSGEVTAASIKAGTEDIELTSSFGAVTLQNASGNNINLSSNSGKITLNEVRATRDITTQTDFGDTEFENGSASSLSIESNSGKASLLKLKVNDQIKVNSGFGEIELEQAFAASYDLHTNSGSVTVDGAKGTLQVNTDFGGIKIENAQSVTLDIKTKSGSVEFSGSLGEGPHKVESEFGEIDLTLPADSALTVDLKTGFGNIKSDLPITVTLTESSNPREPDQIVGSINGGGTQLTVRTNNGNITIRAGK